MPPKVSSIFAPEPYICTFDETLAGPHVLLSRDMLCFCRTVGGAECWWGGGGLVDRFGRGGEATREDTPHLDMGQWMTPTYFR